MANAIGSELLKIGRRRMAWVMASLLLGLSCLGMFLYLIISDDFAEGLPGLAQGSYFLVPVLGLLFGLVFGASASGWEFASRTFPSILAREPNRTVIWAAKLTVLAFVSSAFALASGIGGLLGIAFASLATPIASESGWITAAAGNLLGGLGQSTVMIFSAAALGAGLAMLFKSTVGSVAVGLGFVFVVNGLVGAALNYKWPGTGDYLYTDVVLNFGTLLETDSKYMELSYATVATALTAWTALFILSGMAAFRYRNIS